MLLNRRYRAALCQVTRVATALLSLNLGMTSSVFAQQPVKSEPIATDRPDFVESGQVVGRGRFQFETGVNFERSKAERITVKTLSNSALFRFGTGETWEFRIETEGFIRATSSGPGVSNQLNGFGDTAVGVKWQMQEGAEGKPTIAWLFHADLASGSKEFRGQGTRPSLRAVFEWELDDDASFGLMPGIAQMRNDAGQRYTMGILAATYSRPIGAGWRGFIELSGRQLQSRANGGNLATFDIGVSHLISNDMQIDAWLAKGVTDSAPKIAAGLGLAIRF